MRTYPAPSHAIALPQGQSGHLRVTAMITTSVLLLVGAVTGTGLQAAEHAAYKRMTAAYADEVIDSILVQHERDLAERAHKAFRLAQVHEGLLAELRRADAVIRQRDATIRRLEDETVDLTTALTTARNTAQTASETVATKATRIELLTTNNIALRHQIESLQAQLAEVQQQLQARPEQPRTVSPTTKPRSAGK